VSTAQRTFCPTRRIKARGLLGGVQVIFAQRERFLYNNFTKHLQSAGNAKQASFATMVSD
jgi:hypothetical protein